MTVSEAAATVLDIDPFDESFLADPYAHHAKLRDTGACVWLPALGAFAMARYEDVRAALSDWERFASGRGVGLADWAVEQPWRPPSLLLETDPPLHRRMRKVMNRIFASPDLRRLRPEWALKADELVGRLAAGHTFDAVVDLAEVFPLQVFPDLIGLRQDGRENLLPYAAATFDAFGPRNRIALASEQAAKAAIAWVADACRRENLTPGGWGAQVFAAADDGECTEAEAERLVRSFLSAGVDTTVNGIANLVGAFLQNPLEWDKLRADPALARRAFDESLRWDGTVQTFFRTTVQPVAVGGTAVPAGAKVLLFLAAANRDPRFWHDADRFDVSRVASGHVGFGFGIHQCVGQMLARLEAELVTEALLKRVRTWHMARAPERRLNNTLHAYASLPVEVEP